MAGRAFKVDNNDVNNVFEEVENNDDDYDDDDNDNDSDNNDYDYDTERYLSQS